ncbi:ribonuclease II, chloroplastic/mitochondrial-like [Phragmites australis]|uniref:ribonuclease II, chloroplastic/mitochondrial-like n=1 Tax=Phragmites australis TaxID=29695 RepID=UPI002D784549|nr:ribonuclease II, chloroplastic/mitochondrial-like [Phragmites australis]XP_062225710.1 ribonuclease II, chloroplastic/mitochondrial-like [Phragmites australis]
MRPSPMAAWAAGGCSSAALAFFRFRPLRRAVRPAAAFSGAHSSVLGGCRSRMAHSLVDSVLEELRSGRRVRVSAKIGLQGTKELSDNKIDKRTLHKGLLLEFLKDSERCLLAVVERPDGKKNWMVTDQNGILSSIKPQQVTYVVPGIMDFDYSRIGEFLEKAQDLLDPTVLECAWMELSEKDKSITVEEFAEIVYGTKESLESYCAHFLLSRDIVYFVKVESRDYSIYQPRPPAQVEELLRRKLAKEAAEKELEEFVHLLKSAKALPLDSKPPKDSWLMEEKVRKKIEALQAYTVDACDDGQRRLAGNILKAMGFTRTSSAALKLLINVGYFPVHVNLDIFRYDVRIRYNEEVLSAAEELLADCPDSDMHIRKDLSTLKVYAIDVDEADELDDALSATRLPDGRIKVWIHVADPTCLIKPRSIIDREAMHRGTSIFLPTATFPMFPERLAMNAMSLQQGKECKSVSVSVILHPDGSIAEYTIENSVIKPTYMLTYESATELLYMNLEEEEELRILQEAASIRGQWRRSQGSIDTAMIEPRIKVSNPDDPEPNINLYVEDQANPSMQLVSEMMILCGEAVATFGSDNNLPLPYRGHPQSNTSVSAFSHLPEGPVRSFANIGVLRAAEMDFKKPVPHGVLGIPGYVQFTSPIRRYVDLLAHYQVKAFLRGDSPPYSAGDLEGMTFIASMHVKVARRLHSNSLRYWLLEHLRRQPKGRKYKALILKFVKDRMAVLLLVEVGIQVTTVVSRGKVGDEVTVAVETAHPRDDILSVSEVIQDTEE